jgi:Na+/citrate or Na+/malate symporter
MVKGYLKLFLIWLAAYLIVSFYGEYVLSREVNGFLQLFGFIGVIGVVIYVIGEKIKIFKNKKEEK